MELPGGGNSKMSDELYHHGVKGMKWGVRKKRDKKSFDTSYRSTAISKPSGFSGEKILSVDGNAVDYNRKSHKKAARAAMKEGRAYRRTFKSKAVNRDELSVIGNKFIQTLKDQKDFSSYNAFNSKRHFENLNKAVTNRLASVEDDLKKGITARHPGL